ncbi:MAG: hypothetical protein M0R20_01920 [Candidatus Omnitrophica bacterium]|jgi:hypothetical protein|nr:hypothetical protein [Candidatus Omnitrophota bacterium]
MKKIVFLALFLLLCLPNVNAQTTVDAKYKINPTKDKNSPSGVYIPKNLDDCFKELEKMLTPELIKEMETGTEADMGKYHRGLGMWIRNNWGLWSGSRLEVYFNNLRVHHPDDMSGIILDSFWRKLNNKPIKLEKQIKRYEDYWKSLKDQKIN